MTLFRKLVDQEDGRLMSQNNHLLHVTFFVCEEYVVYSHLQATHLIIFIKFIIYVKSKFMRLPIVFLQTENIH